MVATTLDSEPKQPRCTDEDFFMFIACIAARRSKDPSRQVATGIQLLISIALKFDLFYKSCIQVGACIVNEDKKIVGIGYNGFPLRVSDDNPDMTWGKSSGGASIDDPNPSQVKYPYGKYI